MSNKLVSHTLTCNNQIVKSYWKVLLCKMLYKDEYNSCMVTLKWKRKEKSIFTEVNLNIKHSKVRAALSINFPWFQILSVHIHVCAHTHKNLFHLCLEIHIFCWDAGLGVMCTPSCWNKNSGFTWQWNQFLLCLIAATLLQCVCNSCSMTEACTEGRCALIRRGLDCRSKAFL